VARIFVTRRLADGTLERLAAAHDVEVWPEPRPPARDELAACARSAQGLLTMLSDPVDACLIEACPELRAVANYAVGSDNIDLEAAAARGIRVGVTPDVLTDATADLTWALLLAAARRLPEGVEAVRSGAWRAWEPAGFLGLELRGATLGVVGLGRIGRAVAERAPGFGMMVIHTSRSGGVPLEELLERSDVVSLHCPLTAQTRHLLDERAFGRMKRSAILLNTARGAIVEQAALVDALERGSIAAAALDVTDPEPPAPGDPILRALHLLLLPHVGSATHTARARMAEIAEENLLAALDGRPMPFPAGGSDPTRARARPRA